MMTLATHFKNTHALLGVVVAVVLSLAACDLREKTIEEAHAVPAEGVIATSVDDDTRIITRLVAMHQEGIALSQIALQRSAHTDVTNLASMLETAHTRKLAELTKLAEERALIMPTVLNEKAEQSKADLDKLSGKKFDLAYCQMIVEGHGRIISLMEGAAENATDADLRGWAIRTLPELRQHLEEALACQKKCEAV